MGARWGRAQVGIAVAGAIVVVLGAGIGWFLIAPDDETPQGRPETPQSQGEGQEVSAALEKLSTDPQSLVAASAETFVDQGATSAVPAGSRITADADTWAPDGLGGGLIEVTVAPPGRAARTYTAVMVREADEWKVIATFPVGPGAKQ